MNTPRPGRLTEWIERWNAPLTRFLGRRVPAHIDPEDLAQEVYLRLLRVQDLESIEEPRAYIYQVARNIAAEWRARQQRQGLHSHDEIDNLIDLTTPELQAEHDFDERQLDQALRRLPPMIRAVTYLKLHGGESHEEIALHLGISQRSVRKHLTAGYAGLRRVLVKERTK